MQVQVMNNHTCCKGKLEKGSRINVMNMLSKARNDGI